MINQWNCAHAKPSMYMSVLLIQKCINNNTVYWKIFASLNFHENEILIISRKVCIFANDSRGQRKKNGNGIRGNGNENSRMK